MSGKICSGENLGYDPALDSIGREHLYPYNHHAMAALPVWTRVMEYYEEHHGRPKDFNPPEGLTFTETCLETGLLAGPNCPKVIEDVFVIGTEPHELCRAHDQHQDPGRDFRRLDHQLYPREDWRGKTQSR